MNSIVKNASVEAHYSIGMVERYHGSLRQINSIVTTGIPSIKPDLVLPIFFKAINDLVGLNELVSTLPIFGAYF